MGETMGDLHIPADLHERLVDWRQHGDTGISSDAIVSVMIGSRLLAGRHGMSTPSDPSDLNRCVKLLDRFPEWRPRIAEMARVSEEWADIAACWDILERLLRAEASTGRDAPFTWVALTAINHGAEDAIRLAADMGYDLLRTNEVVDMVTAASE